MGGWLDVVDEEVALVWSKCRGNSWLAVAAKDQGALSNMSVPPVPTPDSPGLVTAITLGYLSTCRYLPSYLDSYARARTHVVRSVTP